MLHDANLVLQSSVTKTASFNSAALTNVGGTPLVNNPMWAEVLYSAASSGTANSTAQFDIQHSPDNGSTWYLLSSGADQVITLTTTAGNGRVFIPVLTKNSQIRLALTITPGSSATPTITYQAYLGESRP